METIDLRDLAEQVVAHLSVLAEEKQQTLMVEPGGRPRCPGDWNVLRQALINLVDNAIKYTPAGGRITVRLAASPHEAAIEVTDSGEGIDPAVAAHVFDRFYRASPETSQAGSGSGLGLAIAKWAVEVNHGRLTIQPAPGGGSTFRMALPVTALQA